MSFLVDSITEIKLKENTDMLMVKSTSVNLKMVLSMATATGRNGRMVGRQIALKANMSLIKKMDKELSHGKVGMSIMEATWKTSGMGMERWLGLMDLPIKENGLKAYSTAEAL